MAETGRGYASEGDAGAQRLGAAYPGRSAWMVTDVNTGSRAVAEPLRLFVLGGVHRNTHACAGWAAEP